MTNSLLTSVRNGGNRSEGFRTNVGVYNANDAPASVTFQIFDDGAAAGHAGGPGRRPGTPASSSTGSSARPASPSLVDVERGHRRDGLGAGLHLRRRDRQQHHRPDLRRPGRPTNRAQPITPTTHTVHVGRGGTNFVDDVSGTGVTTINVGDTVTWVWEGDLHHGSDAGTCSGGGGGNPYGVHTEGYGGGGCTANGKFASGIHMAPFSYSYTFTQSGTFNYFCDVHMNAMTGRVVVNP